MIRFLLGVAVGAGAMYWLLTDQVPFGDRIEAWLGRTSSAYTAEDLRREADSILGPSEGTGASQAGRVR